MRVKRLEIQGFKSFKDKTVIHFDEGITGIVGPNGCGKSNIVDAFFWVMGEQSYKHMRGSSSEDLIFNGSSKYSPLGLAEATLVMETGAVESDPASGATVQDIPIHLRAKEVSVTRRLYRTGEGEYFINGLPARLKDIQELFMDTGVGAKGYSVIEQGQIGKVVNAKPEERRLLIEEAAGIAKYKARKKESIRKMEATQANLSRLNDIIQEIERNLGTLERQAQKAKLYRKYKDELLDKEMTWGRRKNLLLRQKLAELSKQKEALEQEVAGLRARLQSSENSIEIERVQQLSETQRAEAVQARIQELSDSLTVEKSALDLSRRRQSDLTSRLEMLEQERIELEFSIRAETQRLSEREAEVLEAEEAFQNAAKKAQWLDEQVRKMRQETEAARRAADQAKKSLLDDLTLSSDLTSKAAALHSRMESARSQKDRLKQQAAGQSDKIQSIQSEFESLKKAAAETEQKKTNAKSEFIQQRENISAAEEELHRAEMLREESLREVAQTRSRLQSMEELATANEGFSDGAKHVLEWVRNSGSSSIIALANVIDIADEYETALEGWLENQVENLIALDPSAAIEAIEMLKSGQNGRAMIQISDAGMSRSTKTFSEIESILKSKGFDVVGELSQFIQINSDLQSNVKQAALSTISHVCIVRDLSQAGAFLNSGSFQELAGWSIVSLDGTVIDHAGVIRGGAIRSDSETHLIRRKRMIAELREQTSQVENHHEKLGQDVQAAKQNLEAARNKLQNIQTELQTLEIEAASLNREVHQIGRSAQEAESQLNFIHVEIRQFDEEAASAGEERSKIETQLSEMISARTKQEAEISATESLLSQKDVETRASESELQTLRVNEASHRERSQSLRRELDSARGLIQDRERRISEVQKTLERASSEKSEFSGGESQLEQKIEELTRTLATAKEELSLIKDKIEQSSAQLNSTLESIKELHKNIDEKSAASTQNALELEKLNSELNFLIQNLEEKYGPGCLERTPTTPVQEEMSEPIVTAEMSAEEERLLGEEVERLRERIRRLGEVNVMAIDEYEELKKRYDYLLTERGDLEHSIKNLEDAIEHINKTSEDRFRRAFEAIANRFERLFPIIFGGGQAQLSLVYPEGSTDILEAGVDILAQPPGKKVVNITLLSGGEKALTAVSLIFAIFMVKPSPFCVLDEVDAPLDDANIGKFNALLREMSVKSQFILITHNKKTMELNDVLYGVTMEEPGVSKMVSIQMH